MDKSFGASRIERVINGAAREAMRALRREVSDRPMSARLNSTAVLRDAHDIRAMRRRALQAERRG